jgi:hypothetical protein
MNAHFELNRFIRCFIVFSLLKMERRGILIQPLIEYHANRKEWDLKNNFASKLLIVLNLIPH